MLETSAGMLGVPRLFLIELEYRLGQQEAELAFTRRLADEIEDGTLDPEGRWQQIHDELTRAAEEDRPPDLDRYIS